MEYDYIVASGDSFTEGCQYLLGLTPEDTWPGLLAKKYNCDFNNLAYGGASNTVIALQPIQEEISEKIMLAKNPLLLFNFTVHGRWTYFHPMKGRLHSHFGLNLDEFKDTDGPYIFHQKPLVAKTLTLNNDFYSKSFNDPWPKGGGIPVSFGDKNPQTGGAPAFTFHGDEDAWLGPYLYATHQAIKMVMNYKKLMPHATIKWGFVHEQHEEQSFGKDIFTIINGLEAKINKEPWKDKPGKLLSYPGLEDCYNKYTEWKPLGRLSPGYSLDLHISKTDSHPNQKGIARMADIMHNCLQGIHNYETS